MRIISIAPNHIGAVDIGYQGENEATQIHIPIPASCAGYSSTLYVLPPGGGVYPASMTEVIAGTVIWTVTSVDTANAGNGEIQLRFYDDGRIVKMAVFPIRIRRSIDGDPGPAPEPYETWLASLTHLAEETAGYAAEAAEDAQEIRSMSATATTLEPGAAATASYSDGLLSFGIPTGPRGPQGETGERGPRGETGATGQRGEQGPKGDAFTYSDFTPEQLAGLTGPQGERGPAGPQGERGEAFTYSDFTPEQLEALTGPQGERGPAGPQGERGPAGETGAMGPAGPQGERGPQGEHGPAGERGPAGETGPQGPVGSVTIVTVTGSTPSITGEADHRYMCGEVTSISITPPETGIIDVVFTSGATATVVTLAAGVIMPEWYSIEANRIYEISIMDGVYGAVISWPVS